MMALTRQTAVLIERQAVVSKRLENIEAKILKAEQRNYSIDDTTKISLSDLYRYRERCANEWEFIEKRLKQVRDQIFKGI